MESNRGRERRGKVAEIKAMATAAARGWDVALPFHLINEVYDIAIRRDKAEGWIKVQVKRGYWSPKHKSYMADLRTKKKMRYQLEDIDEFMIWIPETDTWYMIPLCDIMTVGQIMLVSSKYDKYQLPREEMTKW